MSDFSQSLKELDEQAAKLKISRNLYLEKALESGDVDAIYKAQQYLNQKSTAAGARGPMNIGGFDKQVTVPGGKSITVDPLDSTGNLGYWDKPAAISFDVLRNMARAPMVRAIINTRKEQIAEFTKPQPDQYSKGFIIRPKKIGIDDIKISSEDKRQIETLTEFIVSGGVDTNRWSQDSFEVFIRKIVEDSLVLDQATFEVVQTRVRKPYQFFATDGATYRYVDTYKSSGGPGAESGKVDGFLPSYCQIYQGRIISEFYPWELSFGIRNPQTSIHKYGYGKSELEDLVQTVTALLNSDTYNSRFFQVGTAPKGALMVKKAGGLNSDVLSEFRREWFNTMSGVDNMHKTPILDAEHMEWLDLQKNNRDMEFSKYQEYLIKLTCAIYKISPEEVGFPIEGTGSGGLGGRGGADSEREYSQDKGLKPLLRSVQGWINKWVLGPLADDKFELIFVGLDSMTSKEEEERLVQAVQNYMTVDEVRELKGLKPLPDKKGAIVLSPIMLQQMMADQQNEMMGNQESNQYVEENYNPFEDGGSEEDENPFLRSADDTLNEIIAESK